MMELAKQVVSLDLAKRLKALGVPQEGCFYWAITRWEKKPLLVSSETFDTLDPSRCHLYQDSGHEGDSWDAREVYSAFTVAELGELLPCCMMSWTTPQSGEMRWWCRRMESHFVTHEESPTFAAATEADARAKMLIHLKEQRYE